MVQFFTHTSIDVQRVQEPDLDSTAVTTVYVCGQSIIQRIHAKQCRCLSEGSMLPSWNVKRQDYECTCTCGESRGCPTSSGDKQAIRVTHRVHAEL